MKVQIKYNNQIVSSNILIADDIISRVIGLMFRSKPLRSSDGLLLEPCKSIHTFFMRYSLDVVFLSNTNLVVKVIRNLKPWKVTPIYFKARKTLELPAGKLPPDIKEGDTLEVLSV
jgi:uncharacterized protein